MPAAVAEPWTVDANVWRRTTAHRLASTSTVTERTLWPVPFCWICRQPTLVAYHGKRRITHLWGDCDYRLVVRRCQNPNCARYKVSIRPEEEGALALPNGKYGLDVVARVGWLHFNEKLSAPAIHRRLRQHGVGVSQRSVADMARGYPELLARGDAGPAWPPGRHARQDRLVLAVDGIRSADDQPLLWLIRDVLSGTVFLGRILSGAPAVDLEAMVGEIAAAVPVPVTAILYSPPSLV